MNDPSHLEVRCLPSGDREFGDYARSVVADTWTRVEELESVVDASRTILRARYPHADVRRQHPLAELTVQTEVLYVYRDGTAA